MSQRYSVCRDNVSGETTINLSVTGLEAPLNNALRRYKYLVFVTPNHALDLSFNIEVFCRDHIADDPYSFSDSGHVYGLWGRMRS